MVIEDSPLISVILPVANNERTLTATIQSIVNQTHRNFELLIINDGSNDRSTQIIDEYCQTHSQLHAIHSKVCSGGAARPRNLGLAKAQGEYLAFIDADDLWHPQKLEIQLHELHSRNLDFISSTCIKINDNEHPDLNTELPIARQFTAVDHEIMLRKNRVVTSSMLLKTSAFIDIGFDEHADYSRVEDYTAWLRMLQKPSIKGGILHLPLVFYRLSSGSLSSSKVRMAMRVYALLSHYQIGGRKLGIKKFYYFFCYALIAIKNRFLKLS